ncbi:MAG: hypothetical protein NT154_39365 [Verrucomicrobia bacterium]|nr:hypothetical protein [Verrucomicrobiota bacterium]
MYLRLWLLPLIVFLPLIGAGQTTIRLAACFQDNMVLQRSTNTLLYGTGPAGKSVTVRYKSATGSNIGRKWTCKIEPAGKWRMELDLSPQVYDSKTPGILWVSEDGKEKKSFELRNVAIGDVWLVAGWENQGVPASPGEIDDSWDKSMVRFSGYRLIRDPSGPETAEIQGWESWPDASHYSRFSTLQLRLAHLLAGGRFTGMAQAGFVGIVRVRPEQLESGLRPEAASLPNGAVFPPEHWNWVQQKVFEARTNRWERLIHYKHLGIVTNEPGIIDYDAPSVFPYAAFSLQTPPAMLFSFKGAVWPRHPGNSGR